MWHSVQALFRCDIQDDVENNLYEKNIFLIDVNDTQDASEKAEQTALSFEHQYKNFEGRDVSWKFVKVLEIQDLSQKDLYDGVEVFFRLLWEHEIEGDV